MLRVFVIEMASSLCVYFFIIVFLAVFIFNFECTTKNDEGLSDLNSIEQHYYDALEPVAQLQWLRRLVKKKNRMLKNIQADRIFNDFMCAMNLLRLNLEILLLRLGEAQAGFQPPTFCKEDVHKLIKELLPLAKENILQETYILFIRFYRSISGSDSETAQNLKFELFSNRCDVWRCAAIAAAVKKLCSSYVNYNGTQDVITYRANLLTNDPLRFPDIIRENNNWNMQEHHIKVLNILLSIIEERPLEYQKFTLKNGKNVVLPLQDPNSTFITC